MDGVKSKETKAWEAQMLHTHPEKAGKRPRAFGAKTEGKIDQANPGCGLTDRGKSNEHGRKNAPYHKGCKIVMGGDDREG
jgi:hypothetical protein